MSKSQLEAVSKPKLTREQWLQTSTDMLKPLFQEKAQVEIPFDVNVSTGFPSTRGTSEKSKTIGQCWVRDASDAKINEIYINPTIDDSIKVLDVLAHELIHASDDCASGHRGFFAKTAKAIGLEGKMTATHAGEDLTAFLKTIVAEIGDFPHSKLNPSIGRKKQSTRLIKIGCECGVIGRMSRGALDAQTWVCTTCETAVIPLD